ncbi:MAG: hypothetical protein ACU0C9_09975 [Paracoccaceae bacterium]
MGVDCATFVQLCELAGRFQTSGRSLMLGRAKFRYFPGKRQIRIPHKNKYQKALDRNGFEFSTQDLVQHDEYSELMFGKLGLGVMEAMDYSDYEFGDSPEFVGHIQDLNKPVLKELHNQFDFIYDGGTLEHIFNVPVALENIFNMLKEDGRFVGVNPLNGWPGHGMYQFSPELIFSFWVRKCGCEVVNCYAMHENPGGYFKIMKDPEDLSGRSRIGRRIIFTRLIPRGRIHLYYEIKKTGDVISKESTLQTSYVRRWGETETVSGG